MPNTPSHFIERGRCFRIVRSGPRCWLPLAVRRCFGVLRRHPCDPCESLASNWWHWVGHRLTRICTDVENSIGIATASGSFRSGQHGFYARPRLSSLENFLVVWGRSPR